MTTTYLPSHMIPVEAASPVLYLIAAGVLVLAALLIRSTNR